MRVSVPFIGLVVAVAVSMLTLGVLSPIPSATAQDVRGEVNRAVDELRKTNQSISVEVDRSTGLPTAIKGLTPRPDPDRDFSISLIRLGSQGWIVMRRASGVEIFATCFSGVIVP